MDNHESPWEIIKNVARESVKQKEYVFACLSTNMANRKHDN